MATTSGQAGGAKKTAIGVAVALAALLIAYGIGRFQGSAAAGAAREQATAARASAENDINKARAEATAHEGTIRLLEARRQLHLTLMALDQRNFGTAQQHLTAATILLGNAGETAGGDVSSLGSRLRETRVIAAGDFAQQREQILDFVRQLDRLLPAESLPGRGMEAGSAASAPPESPVPTAP